jgi:DNA-directed RNA polymerase specialized sigma24 family protein
VFVSSGQATVEVVESARKESGMPDLYRSESDVKTSPGAPRASAAGETPCDPRVVAELVRTLSLRDRLIVCLRYADGLTVAEIAAVLALPPGEIESVLARTVDRAKSMIASLADAA